MSLQAYCSTVFTVLAQVILGLSFVFAAHKADPEKNDNNALKAQLRRLCRLTKLKA